MEAGTEILKLGTPIQNVVRIRPLLPDEPRDGDLRVVENNRKVVLIEPGKLQGTVIMPSAHHLPSPPLPSPPILLP